MLHTIYSFFYGIAVFQEIEIKQAAKTGNKQVTSCWSVLFVDEFKLEVKAE